MKKKTFSILFALVLVVSFSLVTAVPVAAIGGPVTVTLPSGSLTTPDLNPAAGWESISRLTYPIFFDFSAGPTTITVNGMDLTDIWYEGQWPWPPIPESKGAQARFGITADGFWSMHSIHSAIGTGGGSWDEMGADWNHDNGFRKYLMQNQWSGTTPGITIGDHQYNVEAYIPRQPGETPLGSSVNDPSQVTDREYNTFDMKITYTPTGTPGEYTVQGWVRLHKAASTDEDCGWVWNPAINNKLNPEDAWVPFYEGSWEITGDYTSAQPYFEILNWPVVQTNYHTFSWDSMVVGGYPASYTEVWADDGWSGTTPGTEVEPGKYFGFNAFAIIQNGINAVAEAGTVNVAAGTYAESITINKQLTLQGAGSGTDPATNTVISPSTGFTNLVIAAGGSSAVERLVVKDLYLTTGKLPDAPKSKNGMGFTGGPISHVTLQNVAAEYYEHGVQIVGPITVNDLEVIECKFSNNDQQGFGVKTNVSMDGWKFINCEMSNNSEAGLYLFPSPATLTNLEVTGGTYTGTGSFGNIVMLGPLTNATFTDVTAGQGPASGIGFYTYGPVSNVVIINPTISNVTDSSGIYFINATGGSCENIAVTGGTITNCATGVSVYPGSTAISIENVDFAENGIQVIDDAEVLVIEDVLAPNNTFDRAVTVDHEGALLHTIWSKIQDGVNAAVADDTITVAAGTYEENVTIQAGKDNLEIIGHSKDDTFVTIGSGLGFDCYCPVTIRGFDISGTARGSGKAFCLRGGSGGTESDPGVFEDNKCHSLNYGMTTGDWEPRPEWWQIKNNDFYDLRIGVLLEHSYHFEITGNTFKDYKEGIGMGWDCDTARYIDITDNEFLGTTDTELGAAILISSQAQEIHVLGNQIRDSIIGVLIKVKDDLTCPELINVNINFNNIEGNTTGVLNESTEEVDATNNWWGTKDEAAITAMVSDNVDYSPWIGAGVEDSKSEKTETGDDIVVDAKDETDTEVVKSGTGTPTITVAEYSSNPGTGFSGDIGKYVDVHIDDPAGVDEIEIKVYYTNAEIAGRAESSLRLRWWNGTSWVACSVGGVNTTDITGPPVYSGYMWAKVRSNTVPNLAELRGAAFSGHGGTAPPPPPPTVTLESIAASPSSLTLDVDETQQLTVTATYSDESTADVTAEASYESSDTSVTTVSDAGLITGVAEGSAAITVSYTEDEIEATDTVSVTVIVFTPWSYDGDGDGVIDKSEAIVAVVDYFDGFITKDQALEVIALYFG